MKASLFDIKVIAVLTLCAVFAAFMAGRKSVTQITVPDTSALESRLIEQNKETTAQMFARMDSIDKQFIKVNEVLSSMPEFDKIETNNFNTYVTKKDSIVTLPMPEQHNLYLKNKPAFWEKFGDGYYSGK